MPQTATRHASLRPALAAMWLGLALTVLATGYPFLDNATTHVLADHIRAGYPTYSTAEIDEAVGLYLMILSIVGGLGLVTWLVTIRAARSGKSWTRWLALAALLAAACIAITGLTMRDTSGDVGLAPLLAWLQVLPCVAGAAAVVLLWRRQ